jgi:AcrR family transcriptional regulator
MSPRSSKQFDQMRSESVVKILSSALKLFSSKGFYNTSIRDIAKDAKISVGLLYNYYESKEALALDVMKSAFRAIDSIISDKEDCKPEENIANSIKNFIQLVDQELDKIRLLAQMGVHKEKFVLLNKATVEKYQTSVNRFQKNLSRMGVKNSKSEARFIVAALDGIVFEFLLMDNPFDLNEFKRELINKYCQT